VVKVAKSLKKIIIEKLGPAFLEKGLTYDKSVSQNGFFYIFARGEPEPSHEWYKEYQNGNVTSIPNRETVKISKSSIFGISVSLGSIAKGCEDLGYVAGFQKQKWWPINSEEAVEKSFKEILALLDEYGWDWFINAELSPFARRIQKKIEEASDS